LSLLLDGEILNFGLIWKKQSKLAYKTEKRAAELGNPLAKFRLSNDFDLNLADIYALAQYGDAIWTNQTFVSSRKTALRIFLFAAFENHAEAAYRYEKTILDGDGTSIDRMFGISIINKSVDCQKPHDRALYRLGKMHWQDDGVVQDRRKANHLFLQAADLSHAGAAFRYAKILWERKDR
jgi:TPR repeat protein